MGTSELSPEQVKEEFYRLACDFGIRPGADRTYLTISGLSENMGEAIQLVESLLADAQPNPEVLEIMKGDILEGRANTKLNQEANFRMLMQYGLYGPKSPATNVLSADEIQNLKSEELLAHLRDLSKTEHTVLYYGPKTQEEVVAEVNRYHQVPEKLDRCR